MNKLYALLDYAVKELQRITNTIQTGNIPNDKIDFSLFVKAFFTILKETLLTLAIISLNIGIDNCYRTN
jgi:hypothetical protein